MPDRLLRGALGAALLLVSVACSEQVTGSLACPQLCTDQSVQVRDTVLVGGVALDTSFIGFPRLGAPSTLTLVAQGDTADVRLVARFDTLKYTYRPKGAVSDTAITQVDSAALIFLLDTTLARPTGPLRLEAFDVDTTGVDTLPRALLPLFRADRALGARTYTPDELKDTVRLPISNAALLAKITAVRRLRIGLRLVNVGSSPATARIRLSRGIVPKVRFRVSPDTLVPPDTVALFSSTPTDVSAIASALTIYPIIAAGALPAPVNSILAVGGLAGARSYLQFDIPGIVLDSVQVLRATIQLTQRPSRAPGVSGDTVALVTHPVVASPAITDLFTAAQFIGSPAPFRIDTLKLSPRDSGRRDIEIVALIRAWRVLSTTRTTRSVVLRSPGEGDASGELDFFSAEADPALRPTLRLTYVPRRGFGLP